MNVSNIEKYLHFLNASPKSIKVNQLARGAKYVPIAEVEKTLDELFAGLWSIENFNFQVVANEILGSLDLKVFHPIAKTWITRSGAAAIQIMVASGKPTTMEYKIKNALESGFPKLKSECVKNAAKSLGAVFGRSLNRNSTSTINSTSAKIKQIEKILDADNVIFLKAIEAIKKGSVTIPEIEKKYTLSENAIKILNEFNIKKIENE